MLQWLPNKKAFPHKGTDHSGLKNTEDLMMKGQKFITRAPFKSPFQILMSTVHTIKNQEKILV